MNLFGYRASLNLYTGLFVVFLALSLTFAFAAIFDADGGQGRAAIAATLAAVTATMLVLHNEEAKQEQDRSLFFLQSYIDGLTAALALLRQGNQRALWVAAARMLSRCEKIEQEITRPAHRHILELKREELRHSFAHILGLDNPQATASYFYGAPDPGMPIDEAARAASRAIDLPNMRQISTVQWIDEASLHTVWRFSEYRDGHSDPLGGEFDRSRLYELEHSMPGLAEYLHHQDRYRTVAGELIEIPVDLAGVDDGQTGG